IASLYPIVQSDRSIARLHFDERYRRGSAAVAMRGRASRSDRIRFPHSAAPSPGARCRSDFSEHWRAVQSADLLEVGELGDFHTVQPDFPTQPPRAERRVFPIIFDKAHIVLR